MPIFSQKKRLYVSLLVLVGLALLWCRQSNLAYNIAQQRPILLGRYTESYTFFLLAATLLATWVLFAWWTGRPLLPCQNASRQTIFKTIAVLLSVVSAFFCVDLFLRITGRHYYEDPEHAEFYRRLPNQHYANVYNDVPKYPFAYPDLPLGAPSVHYTFRTDAHGFRNTSSADIYSWIAIGDSFTEGSQVSDQDVWVTRLSERLQHPLYNCGISGGSPLTYLALLKVQGENVNAPGALYMLYEGNDFRASNFRAEKKGKGNWYASPGRYLHNSPLRRRLKRLVIHLLGPIGSRRFAGNPAVHSPDHHLYPVAWLPFKVHPEHNTHFAFDVKRLSRHLLTRETFLHSKGCRETMRLMKEFRDICRQQNKTMLVVYAPDAPHVLLDEICRRIPDEQLYAYMATYLKDLPDPPTLKQKLQQGCEVRESVMREFCEAEGIPFLSLTPILKSKTAEGQQTYFCYDQHWPPTGHHIVADFLAEHLPALTDPADKVGSAGSD